MPETAANASLLAVRELNAWYGESHILHGVAFDVAAGEVVTLLGRNGAGKTTTMKSIMGIVGRREGSISLDGLETIRLPSNRIAHLGIALCPEERGIFSSLNVEENLLLPPKVKDGGLTLEQIFTLFPNLKERLSSQGTKLSGGEQQMLAIGRALMTNPKLLILDEATEGLAPLIATTIWRTIRTIRDGGIATVIVDKHFAMLAELADRCVILVKGRKVFDGSPAELAAQPGLREQHLGI